MPGIDSALELLAERLDSGLRSQPSSRSGNLVMLGYLGDRGEDKATRSKIVLTLAGLSPRMDVRTAPRRAPAGAAPALPPLVVDALLLLTVNFPDQYRGALGLLNNALVWLHRNPILATDGGTALTVEPAGLSIEETAALVGMAGAKGMPFAVLRLRGISA